MFSFIKNWYNGTTDEPLVEMNNNEILIMHPINEIHWTAKISRFIVKIILSKLTWIITTIIAIFSYLK